jgi:hypothetical protein
MDFRALSMPSDIPEKRDRDAAKRALSRCALKFGYDGERPYTEMTEYIAEAIAQARREGRDEGRENAKDATPGRHQHGQPARSSGDRS